MNGLALGLEMVRTEEILRLNNLKSSLAAILDKDSEIVSFTRILPVEGKEIFRVGINISDGKKLFKMEVTPKKCNPSILGVKHYPENVFYISDGQKALKLFEGYPTLDIIRTEMKNLGYSFVA